MTKRLVLLTLLLLILAASCGEGPSVAQGTVVSYDATAKILVLKDDSPPQQELTISLQGSDFGVEPEVGDSLRLAFRTEGGKLVALRVMNLSKQTELKKKGH
jgi:hypothetical protein